MNVFSQITLRRRVVYGLFMMAAIGGLIVTSITPQAQAESPDQGVWLIMSHKVVDYKIWKPAHERSATLKRSYGWSKGAVFFIDDDKNHIMVMEQFATIERARAWYDSIDLRDEMAVSGVKTNAEVRYAKSLTGELIP